MKKPRKRVVKTKRLNARIALEKFMAENGYTILGPAVEKTYAMPSEHLNVIMPCGHIQDIRKTHIKKYAVKCRKCVHERHDILAAEHGLEIVDHTIVHKNRETKKMRFKECGHEIVMCVQNLKVIDVFCRECNKERGPISGKSYLYIWQFINHDMPFIKFGFSRNPITRKNQYKVKGYELCAPIFIQEINSGFDAVKTEKELHRTYKKFRLCPVKMKTIMEAGFTECYPIQILDFIISDIVEKYPDTPPLLNAYPDSCPLRK